MLRSFLCCLLLSACCPLLAAEFRIETSVFADGEETPTSQSVTLFAGGAAYDFRDDKHRVTIFRPGAADKPGRFVLLDTMSRRRAEVPGDRVAVTMTKLRRWAAVQDDPFLRFTGDPVFEEEFDAGTGELRLASEYLSYRLVTMPVASREAMGELRTFLDAFVQLHTLLEAGVPPGPRMLVNEALAKHKVAPIEVELYSGSIEGDPALRAEHLITWILSKQDRARIEEAKRHLTEYTEVDCHAFGKHAKDENLVQANHEEDRADQEAAQ